jgi:hypothetical protein
VISPPSIWTRAHDAVGSPSKTRPAEPSFTISFQPRSRTSGRCVWPQQMSRASVRETRSSTTDGSSWASKPWVCEPGRRVAGEDHRVLEDEAALGREAAEPGEPLVTERVVGPFRRVAERLGNAIGHPWERRRVVEVGDRDVGVALDDRRAGRLHLAQRFDGAGRIGPWNTWSPAMMTASGPLLLDGRPDGGQRLEVAVDVGEDREPGRHRRALPAG